VPPPRRRNVDSPICVEHAIVDATEEAEVRALFDRVGALDHLVVTAAPPPGSWGGFLDGDVGELRRYLDAKLGASLACARWAAPRIRPGGSITLLTGVAAVKPRAGMVMVSVAFAAVEALSRALAVELGPVRVNAIRPGFIDSEMWQFLDEPARHALRARVEAAFPVHRTGATADIGHAAVFLMTNPYVTGAILEVTGGEHLVDSFQEG
jgi:NAD(P)-dependent dehydrogenase (short-subunit alcohol dehydrogenase family)